MAADSSLTFRLFGQDVSASRTLRKVGEEAERTGRDIDGNIGNDRKLARAGRAFAALGAAAAVGVGVIGKASITAGADFDKTMRLVAAAGNLPASELKNLSSLALKMGADTSFSAQQAGDAMLELAKGGMSAAEIKGGALKETLTLAAAGGLELGAAATYMATTLATFGLQASDAARVAAALAGGSTASTASVESLGLALSQVGPGAKQAGLSIEETVGVLSAFDQAGIKGSDAGTSLKTMLNALTPSSKKARAAMAELGLEFTNSDGTFKNLSQVAQQLQDKLKGLTPAARAQALETIFGSDAQRAASTLYDLGAKGVGEYTKATSDLQAAQRLATAQTSGTSGALERLGGAVDTAKIALGMALAPAVVAVADSLSGLIGGFAASIPQIGAFVSAFLSGDAGGIGAVGTAFTGLSATIGEFATGLLPTLRDIGADVMAVVGPALREIGNLVVGQVIPAFRQFLPAVTPVAKFLLEILGSAVVGVLKGAVNVIKGVLNVITGLFKIFTGLLTGDWSKAWQGLKQVLSGALTAILGAIQVWWNVGILQVFRRAAQFLLRDIWQGLWRGIQSTANGALRRVNDLIGRALSAVRTLFTRATTAVRDTVTRAFSGVRDSVARAMIATRTQLGAVLAGIRVLFTAAWAAIRTAVSTAIGVIRGVIILGMSAVRGAFSAAWRTITSGVRTAFGAVRGAVSAGVGQVVSLVRSLPTRIMQAIGNLGGLLLRAGRSLIQGLINGIRGALGDLRGTLGAVTNLIPDWKGPADKDARLLFPAGQLIMGGLIGGIDAQRAALQRSLAEVTGVIAGGLDTSTLASPMALAGAAPGVRAPLGVGGRAGGASAFADTSRRTVVEEHTHFEVVAPGAYAEPITERGLVTMLDRVAMLRG